MESQDPNSSSVVDKVRDMSISRRGGVRTRGGRLPPITIRDIPKVTVTKKVIAPKIPQRRAVKKEVFEKPVPLIRRKPCDVKQEDGRGRGRGNKVFLQLEGNFLAQGPAAKIKKEPTDYPSYSIPRSTTRSAREKEDSKTDPRVIQDLLNFYEANGAYEDEFGAIPPYRLPHIKEDGLTTQIKSEPIDEDIVKKEIKSEDDPWNKLEGKVYTKLEPNVKNDIQDFCNVKDEGMLILLHWPNCLPLANDQLIDQPKTGEKNKDSEHKQPPSSIDKLPEGQVGKLQFLKSGGKRLVIGSMVFEFEEGAVSESLKEVVSVRTNDTGGDLTVIGRIDRTMILRPAIDNIVPDES